ncbi:MAG: hypothetical protein JRN51_10425 [Nitrososphaerota archaeon]|jgi:hypothetical protein|nr:hypothetical protein [Nitrososphaerota archaeon]
MNVNPSIKKDDLGKFACMNEARSLYCPRGIGNIWVKGWSRQPQEAERGHS